MKHKVEFKVGDCREELKKLTNVDLILTSPPYNWNKPYDTYNDNLSLAEYEKFTLDWLGAAKNCLKPDGRLAVNIPTVIQFGGHNEFLYPLFANWVSRAGFVLMEEIAWIKVADIQNAESYRASGNTGWGSFTNPSSPFCRSIKEYILVAHNGQRKKDGAKENIDILPEEFVDWTHDAWAVIGKSNPHHPAVWPEEIPHRLMKMYTYRGDLCVDPFSGIGTSGLVAWKLGRNFVGFDVSQKYIDEANRELKKLREQTTLSRYV